MSFDWHKRFHAEMLERGEELTLEQLGALTLLSDLIYSLGPIVDDERRIARKLNCHVNKWRPIRQRLLELGLLVVADGRLDYPPAFHWRLDRDSKHNLRRLVGQLGGTRSAETRKLNGLGEAKFKQIRGDIDSEEKKEATSVETLRRTRRQ